MAAAVFPDNTVLINFACVGRLDLLEGWLRGRGRWTEAVEYEARRSAGYFPALQELIDRQAFGELVVPDPQSVAEIDALRRTVFGGSRSKPLQHLGESQTCYLLQRDPAWRGSWWVSDDRDALEYARQQGITTRQTIDMFRHLVADGDLTTEVAYKIMMEIADHDRSLEVPSRADDLRE